MSSLRAVTLTTRLYLAFFLADKAGAEGAWGPGLFSCFDDWFVCCVGCNIPSVMYGECSSGV
jgi:hypothetical protein